MAGSLPDFGWFTTWVDEQLALCLSFARPIGAADMLRVLGADSDAIETRTLREADDDPTVHRVLMGHRDGWRYALEHLTVVGCDPESLQRLAGPGEAFALCYTQTISTFLYARGGELVSGFDMDAPRIRFGSEPGKFDAEMAAAGFLDPEPPGDAAGARLVAMLFGIEMDQQMLEGPLPSAELPAPD